MASSISRIGRIERRAGVWIVSSADTTFTEKHTDGATRVINTHYVITDVNFRPDFAELGAFVPSFHDGAFVVVDGVDSTPIPLRWHDGHVVPAVDDATRARLEKEIQDALKEKQGQ